jgi:hypothetical protein
MELDSRCDTGRLPRGERSQTIQVKVAAQSPIGKALHLKFLAGKVKSAADGCPIG